jgi:hypothetical protein
VCSPSRVLPSYDHRELSVIGEMAGVTSSSALNPTVVSIRG